MTQLGYDADGEPVELPEMATGWRVSRMKDSGAPALVYGARGTPVVIPLDADIEDLRREVVSPGKYRLEAVDEKGRKLGAKFAYVCVPETEPAEPEPEMAPARDESAAASPNAMTVVLEAMRQNSEMARTNAEMVRAIVDRFPAMMESAAILLKAADGAGIPARKPMREESDEGHSKDEDDDEDDEDDDDRNEGQPEPGALGVDLKNLVSNIDLNRVIANIVTDLATKIAKGGVQIPNLAEILDWRKAASNSKKKGPGASAKTDDEPAARPQAAEPAAGEGAAKQQKTQPKGTPTTKPGASAASAPVPQPATEPAEATKTPESAATDDELPPLSLKAMAHFAAIQNELTPEEAALARAAAAELSPRDVRAWFDQLSAMSVPEAVARVRSLLAASKPEAA